MATRIHTPKTTFGPLRARPFTVCSFHGVVYDASPNQPFKATLTEDLDLEQRFGLRFPFPLSSSFSVVLTLSSLSRIAEQNPESTKRDIRRSGCTPLHPVDPDYPYTSRVIFYVPPLSVPSFLTLHICLCEMIV